jgi:hypothetical protein
MLFFILYYNHLIKLNPFKKIFKKRLEVKLRKNLFVKYVVTCT